MVKIKKSAVCKAYKDGCSDVRKVLGTLFPFLTEEKKEEKMVEEKGFPQVWPGVEEADPGKFYLRLFNRYSSRHRRGVILRLVNANGDVVSSGNILAVYNSGCKLIDNFDIDNFSGIAKDASGGISIVHDQFFNEV